MIGPADGACALHAGVAAKFTCPRCGAFGCGECERRARPDAHPMCPECWARRTEAVASNTKTSEMMLPNATLALGILSLVPLVWPAWIGVFIVGSVALARLPAGHPGRARAALGMAIAPAGVITTAIAFYLLVFDH